MPSVPKPTPILKEPKQLKGKPHAIPPFVKASVFGRDNYICQWCLEPGGALDAHHRQRRSQGGKDVAWNLVSVHRKCHSYIHEHPAEAKIAGFLA